MRCVGNGKFGAVVICGVEEGRRTCVNGLPIIPATVRMLGRFERLKVLDHPSLCVYIELIRCSLAPNAVILVSEHYQTSLSDLITSLSLSPETSLHVVSQLLEGVSYLHEAGITIGLLRPHTILITTEVQTSFPSIRITQYGLSYISMGGVDMQGGISYGYGTAPERLLNRCIEEVRATRKSDIWAIGIVLLEMYTSVLLDKIWSFTQYLAILKTSILKAKDSSLLSSILNALCPASPVTRNCHSWLHNIIEQCLMLLPSQRPSTTKLKDSFKLGHRKASSSIVDLETVEQIEARIKFSMDDWQISDISFDEAFFLWKLSGSSVESILIKNSIIKLHHPVLIAPCIIVEDFRMFGNESARRFHVECDVFVLPDQNVRQKLGALDDVHLLHSIESDGYHSEETDFGANLSVVVKEKDIAYQARRMRMIGHLLSSQLYKAQELKHFVWFDVPPLLRGQVWSVLLGVRRSDSIDFLQLDTLAPHISDRQLDVDIPRCHQYEELMTSPAAHARLRRLLKAWLLCHPQYVYWQGCDSLAAPFLLLHFNDLRTALSCLTAFIKKYLHNFFLRDNSAVIQEYLAVFNHLLAFVDSTLYSHLASLDFYPELFAIPWFLTCFAHVLPIHKLFHVWDNLLLNDVSFPLFIGLAILHQLRPRLIEASFNDAILLFSDLPDLSIERVVADSVCFYKRVPPSCAYRSHSIQNLGESCEKPRSLPCSLSPLSYIQLKMWDCPRISVEEFTWRVKEELIVVIDIRPQSKFIRGCVVRSINYSNPKDVSLLNVGEVLKRAQHNQHPICIVTGNDWDVAKKFCSDLVQRGVDGICVLDGGYESVRKDRTIIHIPH